MVDGHGGSLLQLFFIGQSLLDDVYYMLNLLTTSVDTSNMTITSVITSIKSCITTCQQKDWLNKHNNPLAKLSKIVNVNFPHTPSKVGVLERIIFSHTPEEAMSVGLAKACVL